MCKINCLILMFISISYYELVFLPFIGAFLIEKSFVKSYNADLASRDESDDSKSYPTKRKIPNLDQSYYLVQKEEQPEVDYSDTFSAPNLRLRRIGETALNFQPLREFREHPVAVYERTGGTKKSPTQRSFDPDTISKRDVENVRYRPSGDSYGYVYKKGRLFGVLEPYPQVYELSPIAGSSEALDDSEEGQFADTKLGRFDDRLEEGPVKLADEKYPTILTDFKIDSKLGSSNDLKRDNHGSMLSGKEAESKDKTKKAPNVSLRERDNQVWKNSKRDAQMDQLKAAVNRMQNPVAGDDVEEIEANLKDILGELGIIEDEGSSKRETDKEDENLSEGPNKIEMVRATRNPKTDSIIKPSSEDRINVANYQSEGEAFVRSKRHETSTENADIMKGLEQSGDLTVSGNKSPLASAGNGPEITDKNKDYGSSTPNAVNLEPAKDELGDLNYQKLIEQNLQAKIDAIKEEVKREISSLQVKTAPESADSQTGKRETIGGTLYKKKAGDLNPAEHPEEKLAPHIRRRRNLETDYGDGGGGGGSLTKNEDPEVSLGDGGGDSSDTPQKIEESSAVNKELKTYESQRERREIFQKEPSYTYPSKKSADVFLPERNFAYVPYRPEEEEMDEEGDEFDDGSFDDRTANVQKRSLDYYDVPIRKYDYARRFVAKLNPDVYENPSPYLGNYLYNPEGYIRKKRQGFEHLIAFHGGGQTRHHLAAVRERNLQQFSNEERAKRHFKRGQNDGEAAQNVVDLADADPFGALPQSYEGELSRFKRVKRQPKLLQN